MTSTDATGPDDWTEERFEELARYWPTKLVLESAALGLYEHVADAPVAGAELARRLHLDERAAVLFLDALVALGLLRKTDGRYAASVPALRYLVPGSPDYLGHSLIAANRGWEVWGRLGAGLATGRAQREGSIFADDPAAARDLLLAIDRRAIPRADALLEHGMIELEGRERMLDLGGGAGTYSIAFCRAEPDLHATLVDLPAAAELAREQVGRAGLTNRVDVVEADFDRDELTGSYDLIWVSNVIHGRDADSNQALLSRLRDRLEPGGALVIHDIIMEEDRTRPPRGAIFSVHMLLYSGSGRCYTFAEIAGWLDAAGLAEKRRVRDPRGDHDLITATRQTE